MRHFPLGGEYVDALQNTSLCFTDPDLRSTRPAVTKLGLPKPISGNFASVFELTAPSGRRYAVKCFTREVADQKLRYQAISDHLATVRHPWKVGFEYLAQGILVGDEWYPVLKMEWVSGTGLSRWIEGNLNHAPAIRLIAERFAELTGQLAEASIAHGDLQHGNLLVSTNDALRLVDYDGMYVPGLVGLPATEKGHRNYQSPHRSDADFGPELDRFSAWVIYLSLVALAADPGLWGRLHEPGGEYLLLDGGDFENPAASLRLPALLHHSAREVRELTERVHDQLGTPLSRLPELLPLAAPIGASPTHSSLSSPPPPRAGTLPDWMAGHLLVEPPHPPVTFADHRPFFRTTFFILAVLSAGVLAVLSLLTPPETLAGAAGAAGGLVILYRRRPESVSKRQAHQHHDKMIRQFGEPREALTRLERESAVFEKDATARAASFTVRQQDLQKRQQEELARIERNTQQRINGVDAQLRGVTAQKNQEIADELRHIQDQHVRTRLARIAIELGQIPGIGEKAVRNLRYDGITTAADFTGIRLTTGSARYGTSIAYFKLTRGRSVRVEGIGEVKATALDAWREHHERQARLTQPTALPADRRQAIAARFATQERMLTAQKATARKDADAERDVVVARLAADRTALFDEQRRADIEIATRRAELDQGIKDLQASASAGLAKIREAEEELARYELITFARFIGFALIGRSA